MSVLNRLGWCVNGLVLALISPLAGSVTGCTPTTNVAVHDGPVVEGVTVVGTGEVQVEPDIAKVNIGVETRALDVQRAADEATKNMNAVIAAVAALGVPREDMRTHSYSVDYQERPDPPPRPRPLPEARPATPAGKAEASSVEAAPLRPEPQGQYHVRNMLEVVVRDIGSAGQILAAALEAGANQVWGIRFELEDPSAAETAARQKAVADAKERAGEIASLTGIQLGPIISVVELGRHDGPIAFQSAAALRMEGSGPVPVERGRISVQRSVQMVFARQQSASSSP